tara:strand:- start:10333 stop:11526 length:1194 start_codon:yes stop_codon:yes gene_type:complete
LYFFLNKPNSNISPIRLRYYIKSEKKIFNYSTGISIDPKNWNKENRMPKAKAGVAGFELKQITSQLNRYVEELHTSINNIESEDKPVTREELKKRLNQRFKHVFVKKTTLLDHLDAFIEEKVSFGKYQNRTIDKYNALKNKIIYFKKDAKLTDINKKFMIDFINFLRLKHNMTDITLNRNIGYLKTFLKWCRYSGIKLDETYNQVTVSTRDADHVHLSKEQVRTLENLILNKTLNKYRELFLIGVYSGQRFSDYTVFKKSDVVNGRIEKRAEKTDYKSYIPISKKLETLLNKWEWRLPKVSNQKFNQNIKKVCEIAGFTDEVTKTTYIGNKKIESIEPFYKRVGSHTARRTFITLAANANVPDHVIMAICGIRDSKTLKTYKKFNPNVLENYVETIF